MTLRYSWDSVAFPSMMVPGSTAIMFMFMLPGGFMFMFMGGIMDISMFISIPGPNARLINGVRQTVPLITSHVSDGQAKSMAGRRCSSNKSQLSSLSSTQLMTSLQSLWSKWQKDHRECGDDAHLRPQLWHIRGLVEKLGPISISDKMSFYEISWSLEAARLVV